VSDIGIREGGLGVCVCFHFGGGSPRGVDLAFAVEDRSSLLLATKTGRSGTIRLWDVDERKCIREWEAEEKEGFEVRLSPLLDAHREFPPMI